MNTISSREHSADTARQSRLARLGILDEPMGYVDGLNLYEFVGDNPVNATDPYGLAAEKEYPIGEPGTGDAQGDATVSVTGKNLCQKGTKGKIELTVHYKLRSGLSGKPSDQGYLLINGGRVDPVGDPKDVKVVTATWSTDVPADGKGHAGTIYVAAILDNQVLSAKDDPTGIGKTGVIHAWRVKWNYECPCNGAVTNEVQFEQDRDGNLLDKDPGDK